MPAILLKSCAQVCISQCPRNVQRIANEVHNSKLYNTYYISEQCECFQFGIFHCQIASVLFQQDSAPNSKVHKKMSMHKCVTSEMMQCIYFYDEK